MFKSKEQASGGPTLWNAQDRIQSGGKPADRGCGRGSLLGIPHYVAVCHEERENLQFTSRSVPAKVPLKLLSPVLN